MSGRGVDSTSHKWAMVGYKGGHCECGCGRRVTKTMMPKFHFHHKIPVNNGKDKSDRWSAVGLWVPFTKEWFAWADTVEMIFEECHKKRHSKQLTIDWDAQARIDAADQSEPVHQLKLVIDNAA